MAFSSQPNCRSVDTFNPAVAPRTRGSLLGAKDQAFTGLQKAYEQRSPFIEFVKAVPDFDNIRSDPRYVEFLHRVGLKE